MASVRFSLVMIPVYSDEEDRKSSPYSGEDWYGERISWKWMNTIMRVNSLVQKVSKAAAFCRRDRSD